ncbi:MULTISPECIES: copper homeostasis protein CutC [unclassified Klebsiella]|uniref:copper homeostasis protein CutC n=1 Tax=Enterobacteriaceae TaxID=543 RepID=UPI0015DD06FE|nr:MULTISPECIES: copper homeostasis protein CutC [unclassified Klebsiella]HAT3951894.1 copper homeostasis protein CutC [Kluyvera ascorbata]BBR59365.1 copper homeostasis protein CutC [Klebsiella sp. WP4-W18-ESBL-05]BBS91294.1 copper homeostasis protein CutC [Klebsiella sp. WP7-S18-CRE-02]BBS96316.1 copper homeostasis protein CutC [Klebsiella sp. WP7-S18-CRE-03]BBT01348.1 copper homeostasis protein CutC [Klebsiella sp. WP7-S18-ESBL-04]
MALLEICCYSTECAVIAQQNGADRIELCAAPLEGGLTPSYGVLRATRQRVTIPVHPIIRPRGGDFCYTDGEFAAMLEDVRQIRSLGYPGFVIGVLNPEGQVDVPRMRQIMVAAGPLAVTFHRAFDMCANPLQAADVLADLGVSRVLTSGQQPSAEKGISLIRELIAREGTPTVMAGAGVRASNLSLFLEAGVKEVHSSAGQWLPSEMRYRNPGLSMSTDPDADEYSRYAVDGAAVAAMSAIVARHE